MKLKDLKEWGGRDLPGFGDEATWGGRRPYGEDDDDDRGDFASYLSSEYTETPELDKDCFMIDPGEFSKTMTEEDILESLKILGYKIQNDTGHPFATAFMHAIKPMWNFCCDGPDRFVKNEHVSELEELCTPVGKQFTITQLQVLCKKWLAIAESSPTTKKEILSEFRGH